MHKIRLRRPWSRRIDRQQEPVRVDVPDTDRVSAGGDDETVEYRRHFNRPTGLGPEDRVFLSVGGWSGKLHRLTVNGADVPTGAAPLLVDVTDLLRAGNEIQLTLEADEDLPRLSGEVTLLIGAGD